MKPAIEWVDEFYGIGEGAGRAIPSEVLSLVQRIREEALDTIEYFVMKVGTFATASDADRIQKLTLGEVARLRKL